MNRSQSVTLSTEPAGPEGSPRRAVDLSAGRIRYRDEGDGPPVVFVHGVFTDSAVWRKLENPLLSAGLRFVAPDLPLGAHVAPMGPGADLSPTGIAALIEEFLDALDLRGVTLVATDTGGAITQLLLARGCARVARVVLTPCDSFENFLPPSIRLLQFAARVPGLINVVAQPLRVRPVRWLTYRTLAKHGVPNGVTRKWARPLATNRGIRRDLAKFLAAIDHRDTLAAAERLRTFDRPVLLVWPRRAPYFPFAHAERWQRTLPNARIVEASDSYTFVSEDEPLTLARELIRFVTASAATAEPGTSR